MQTYVWGILIFAFLLDILRNSLKTEYTHQNETVDKVDAVNIAENIPPYEPGIKVKLDNQQDLLVQYEGENINKIFNQKTNDIYFEDLRRVLSGNYSNVDVSGQEYPIGILRKLIAKLVFFLQMIVLANIVGGESIRSHFSFVPREWFDFIDSKKWVVGILTFLVGNQIQSLLTSSGAFEVWSKLQIGNVPQLDDIVRIINSMGFQLN